MIYPDAFILRDVRGGEVLRGEFRWVPEGVVLKGHVVYLRLDANDLDPRAVRTFRRVGVQDGESVFAEAAGDLGLPARDLR